MSTLIETKQLTKHFTVGRNQTVHAVDKVSLKIKKGEVMGLVGESGSGKSTFGKTLLGLHRKTSGDIFYKNKPLPMNYKPSDFQKYAASMQMIFQDPYSSLNPRMTAGEIVGEGLYLHSKLNSKEIREAVSKWFALVGLHESYMSRYPHEFSGGQRQRIGIARALIMEPEFVVCDEPISALDVSVQAQIVNLLEELKSSLSLTLLFIAHDLSMVRYVSDKMAVMYLGEIVEIGSSNDVFFSPKHPYTKLLISSNPEPIPNQNNKNKVSIKGEIPSAMNIKPGCRFADRCPSVMEDCKKNTPKLRATNNNPTDNNQLAACYLY